MIDLKLIKEGLKLAQETNPEDELIRMALGKNKYPSNWKEFKRMLNYRYG